MPRLDGVKPSRQWILYSLLRVGLFAVVLAVLLLVGVNPWLSAVIAAIIGLCVTYIFFRTPRDAVARSFYEFRTGEHRDLDAETEDDAVDGNRPSAEPASSEGERGAESETEEQRGQAG